MGNKTSYSGGLKNEEGMLAYMELAGVSSVPQYDPLGYMYLVTVSALVFTLAEIQSYMTLTFASEVSWMSTVGTSLDNCDCVRKNYDNGGIHGR